MKILSSRHKWRYFGHTCSENWTLN